MNFLDMYESSLHQSSKHSNAKNIAFKSAIVISIIVNILFISMFIYDYNKVEVNTNNISSDDCKPSVMLNDSLTLDYVCIQKLLEKHKVKFSYIVLGQIYWESSNLKYRPRIKDNNLLGMRVAAQRYCFAINNWDYGAFAKFNDIEDCIRDYKSWQIQNAFHITSESEYCKLLDSVYDFEDLNYSKRVLSVVPIILKQINKK